jgi:hypothetical protein
VVIGVFLTDRSGAGSAPLVIFGVVIAYITTIAISRPQVPDTAATVAPSRSPESSRSDDARHASLPEESLK